MPIDYSPYRLNEMKRDYNRKVIVASVFLQTLVSGNLNLYLLRDKTDKIHFFYSESK
jgi:hypothetical protein